jgi:hypothetical protein
VYFERSVAWKSSEPEFDTKKFIRALVSSKQMKCVLSSYALVAPTPEREQVSESSGQPMIRTVSSTPVQ